VLGNITFSTPHEGSVVSEGFRRHFTTCHDDVSDTTLTDIDEVLLVGYQVTSLLWELL
jgi:hypothetical protein